MRGAGETRVKIAKIQRYINTYLNNPPLNHGEFDDTHWIPRNLRVRSVKGFLSYTTLETKFWTYCNRLENNCHMVKKKITLKKGKPTLSSGDREEPVYVTCWFHVVGKSQSILSNGTILYRLFSF